MSGRARRASRGLAGAALGASLALGCAGTGDPICSETVAATAAAAPPASAAVGPRAANAPALDAAEGEDAPRITVTVANAPDDRVLPLDAVHGSFDEPIVLVASAASPRGTFGFEGGDQGLAAAGAPEKQRVPVAITSAYSGGDGAVPLRLLDPLSGRDVTALEMAAGQHAYLRVAGDGFSREATYRASLTIFGAEPVVYRLRIQSNRPHRPLGLRASKWASTFADVPIFQRQGVRLVLPVDDAASAPAPYHVAVRPPSEMIDGAEPLPACGIVARPSSQGDLIVVEVPPLDTGRYAGVLEIQGEPLAVDITLKNAFWWVWLLVATGAALSLGLREYMRYRTAREEAEKNIAAKERELIKKSEGLGLLTWDELCVRNTLRLARGRKGYLALDDVAAILEDATPRERPERAEIDRALNETPLPSPLRAELRARFERINYLSAREDVREIDQGLAELAREAKDGFQSALVAWLAALKEACWAHEERIRAALAREPLASDAVAAKRITAASHVMMQLVEDARALALDSGLSVGQAEVLSKIEPAFRKIEAWARAGRVPDEITAMIHSDLRGVSQPAEAPPAAAPAGLRLRARGVGQALNANEEISFELVAAEGALEDAAPYQPAGVVIEWWVDRQRVGRGGARMTYLFQDAGWLGWRRRRVEARIQGRAIAVWFERVRRPELSIAVYERTWSLAARGAATLVGVIVTGAAAVGLLWSNKAFGGWSDYIAAALTGLGADLAIVAGGGRLLDNVLAAVAGRRREDTA